MTEQNTPRAYFDYVCVKVEKEHDDTIKVGNLELAVDYSYRPNWFKRIYADVVSVPVQLTPAPEIAHEFNSLTGRNDHYHKRYWPRHCEIEPGDRIYFKFNALKDNYFDYNGETYFRVDFNLIFCYVRNGEINMVNNRILVTPVYEPWEKCFSKNALIVKTIPEPKSVYDFNMLGRFDYIVKEHRAYLKQQGILTHIGKELPGKQIHNIKPGSKIRFSKGSEFENEIEGATYYVMTQDDILAVEEAFI